MEAAVKSVAATESTDDGHLTSLMFSLNRLRSLDMLTDLVVRSGSTEVQKSSFFNALLGFG
jgi:hypothetical protein